MVSELVLLRPASVPTNDGFYVRVGPRRKKESLISDLKNFIELRFNSPRPQVFVSEDGGVVITGLYEGIPDDADYNHEIFDHILDLVGWIEGCVELPSASEEKGSDHDQLTKEVSMNEPLVMEIDSTLKFDEGLGQNEAKISPTLMKESSCFGARHMLDEMPEPGADLKTIEVSDLSDVRPLLTVNKEFIGSIKGLEELFVHDDLGFDPGGKSSVDLAHNSDLNDDCDDVLSVERLLVDDDLIMGECPIQMEEIDELLVVEETSNLDARQVFDKMLDPKKWPELELRVELPKGVNAIGKHELVTSTSTLLLLRGRADSKMSKASEMVAYDRVGSVIYVPEGDIVVHNSQSTNASDFDDVLASEMMNSLQSFPFGIVVDELDCWIFKLHYTEELIFDLGVGFNGLSIDASKLHDPFGGMLAFPNGSHMMSLDFLASLITHDEYLSDQWVEDFALDGGQSGCEELISLSGMKFDPGWFEFADVGNYLGNKYKLKSSEGAKKILQKGSLICIKMRSERGFSVSLEMRVIIVRMASKIILAHVQPTIKKNTLSNSQSRTAVRTSLLRVNFDPGGVWYTAGEVALSVNASERWGFELFQVDITTMMGIKKWKSMFHMCLATNAHFGVLICNPGEIDLYCATREMSTMLGKCWNLEGYELNLFVLNQNKTGKLLPSVGCSYSDSQLLIFDPGITFTEEWKTEVVVAATDRCISMKLACGDMRLNFLPGNMYFNCTSAEFAHSVSTELGIKVLISSWEMSFDPGGTCLRLSFVSQNCNTIYDSFLAQKSSTCGIFTYCEKKLIGSLCKSLNPREDLGVDVAYESEKASPSLLTETKGSLNDCEVDQTPQQPVKDFCTDRLNQFELRGLLEDQLQASLENNKVLQFVGFAPSFVECLLMEESVQVSNGSVWFPTVFDPGGNGLKLSDLIMYSPYGSVFMLLKLCLCEKAITLGAVCELLKFSDMKGGLIPGTLKDKILLASYQLLLDYCWITAVRMMPFEETLATDEAKENWSLIINNLSTLFISVGFHSFTKDEGVSASMVLVFDPGGKWSNLSNEVQHTRSLDILNFRELFHVLPYATILSSLRTRMFRRGSIVTGQLYYSCSFNCKPGWVMFNYYICHSRFTMLAYKALM